MTVIYFLSFPTRIKHAKTIGVSGTETAAYVVMEQLALLNPSETYVIWADLIEEPMDRGSTVPKNLFFANSLSDEWVNNTTTFIASVQFNLPDILNRMQNLKHVVFVTQTIPCGAFMNDFNEMKRQQKKISVVYLCEWTRSYVDHLTNHAIDVADKYIIGNPLMSSCLQPLTFERKKNSFVFLATWERGGVVALEAFKQIRKVHHDATFHIASYHHDLPKENIDDGIHVHHSLGKNELSILLNKSEYFLYPLNLPTGQIHKDTFACCVSESIASGVQVISYAQSALAEIYANMIDFIPIPDAKIIDSVTNFNFHAYEPWLNSQDGVNNIVKHTLKVMENRDETEIKRRAVIIRDKYSELTIGNMWNKVIKPDEQQAERKVIMTCFAGRKHNLEVLFPYVDKLIDTNQIAEFHLWNFTRIANDDEWLKINVPQHKGFSLIHVHNKGSWTEYYKYYTQSKFPNSIIIKCDDDIVYIDTDAFSNFIKERSSDKHTLLMFPSIVNNGVCAYHQQRLGLIDASFGEELPYDIFNGKLWSSGKLCSKLHQYFIDNVSAWTLKSSAKTPATIQHKIGDRISINFFAILSEDLFLYDLLTTPYPDDEHELTTVLPPKIGRYHSIYMPMTVAHLAFYQQRSTGLDEPDMIKRYTELRNKKINVPIRKNKIL